MSNAHRQPRTPEQATVLLERYSHLAGELALIEVTRTAAIAAANKSADTDALPIIDELKLIHEKLQPWWKASGASLVKKGQKSIELGGCMIGTRAGAVSLSFSNGDDKAALAALRANVWAKPYVKITYSVKKAVTLAALDGKHADQLKELGFGKDEPGDIFFVKAVAQSGSVTAA